MAILQMLKSKLRMRCFLLQVPPRGRKSVGSHRGLSDPGLLLTTKRFWLSFPFPASSNVAFLTPGPYAHSPGEKEQRRRGEQLRRGGRKAGRTEDREQEGDAF